MKEKYTITLTETERQWLANYQGYNEPESLRAKAVALDTCKAIVLPEPSDPVECQRPTGHEGCHQWDSVIDALRHSKVRVQWGWWP